MRTLDLQPATDAGRRFVEIAESHIDGLAARAAAHDRDAAFPADNFDDLHRSGFLAATVPVELGGLGVRSMVDIAAAFNRLGRGDGATAIAAHMHVAVVLGVAAGWGRVLATGGDTEALDLLLKGVVAGEVLICSAATEAGVTAGYQMTTATRTEGGWLVNGRKTFATNSAAATLFTVPLRVVDDEVGFRYGSAWVPAGAPGMEVRDSWDALGMRSTRSNDVVFTDCFVPDSLLQTAGPWGKLDAGFITYMIGGNVGLLASFLGIAEAARDHITELLRTRRKLPSNSILATRSFAQRGMAEIEVLLEAARAMLERSARLADETFGFAATSVPTLEELHELMVGFQATKLVVNRNAIEVVDQAMQLSGGSGYMTSSPLSRLYRDVRAGPFMQAYSPNEAYEYMGKVSLGLEPLVEA